MPDILAKAVYRLAWKKTSASSVPGPGRLYSRQGTDDDDESYALYVYVRISYCVYVYLFICTSLFMPACVLYAYLYLYSFMCMHVCMSCILYHVKPAHVRLC